MYLIPLAWLYVVLMMAAAEATSPNGTVLGAVFTLVLYGLLPVGLILYFIGTPARKRALRAKEAAAWLQAQEAQQNSTSLQPDTSGHATADSVAPVGKET